MAPSPPILPPPHHVLLAAVIILVSGLHSKGTAATNVDRHSNVQKPGHARQTRQSWVRRSELISVQDPSDFRAFFQAYSKFDGIRQTQVHNA